MQLTKSGYTFKMQDGGKFEIYDSSDELLLVKNVGIPYLPLANRAVIWGEPKIEKEKRKDADVFIYKIKSNWLYDNPQVILECKDDYIEFYFKATVKSRVAINKWYLLPGGSQINAIECLDFRSHINSPNAYEVHQIILGRRKLGTIGLEANTEDGDLMFAPHPMLFVFRHLEDSLVIAPMQLVSAESLQIKTIKGSTTIKDFYVRVGDNLFWTEEGEELESAHFMIMLSKKKDVYETLSQYTGFLVRDGYAKAKKESEIEPWWLVPMWCSWGDQHVLPDSADVVSVAYKAEDRWRAVNNIGVELLNKVVNVIERHKLPIRTLILDDRWYTKQGDMYADTTKFPDMRKVVDELHSKGFKVLAWASLYQFDKDSEVYTKHPDWFIVHHYSRNWHNPEKDIIHIDYSNEKIAREYSGDLMTRLLSDKPGCYNFDGIKFDWPFLLPHDYPYQNRDWVGKEKTVYNTQKLIYNTAKEIKKDCLIIGVSPHPFFTDTQDIIRTYDVATFDLSINLERAKYIRSIIPGILPALDEHTYYQNFFRYIRERSKIGIPMIYNILCFNSDGYAYKEDDYKQLKSILDDYVNRTPKLKKYLSSLR